MLRYSGEVPDGKKAHVVMSTADVDFSDPVEFLGEWVDHMVN